MTERNRRIYFTLQFALVFYVAGAALVESFANYPSWRVIGAAEFKAYHAALSARIIPLMVLPWLFEIVSTFVLIRFRPRAVPLRGLAFAQALNLIALASSIFIQIPIQFELGENGFSPSAIDRLIATDPIRWVALIIKVVIYVWMMVRCMAEVGELSPEGPTAPTSVG